MPASRQTSPLDVDDPLRPHHAILIAAETFGLTGCENDVQLMAEVLSRYGFTHPDILMGSRATRSAILEAFDSLVDRVRPGDVVVVYYSGHGGRLPHPDWAARQASGRSPFLQFLVPTDAGGSSDDDFRGLLAEEMTALQGRLTDVTFNVTTILDCCHSAFMARGTDPASDMGPTGSTGMDLVIKAVDRQFPVAGALRRLREVPPERQAADTTPFAVRLVACQPEQSAYERQSYRGCRHGVLTDALADALDQFGERNVPWHTLMDVVRRRVQAAVPQQRPDVEGPLARLPFSTVERGQGLRLPVGVDDDGAWVEGAVLFGLHPSDALRLVDADVSNLAGSPSAADARVEQIDSDGRASLHVTLATGVAALPQPCDAIPIKLRSAPLTVRVDLADGGGTSLRAALERSPLLEAADQGVAVVKSPQPGTLTVEDAFGVAAVPSPLPNNPDGCAAVVSRLDRWARADRLRSLPSGAGTARLAPDVVVQLRTHEGDEPVIRRASGEQLTAGDRVSVVGVNRGPHTRWVWLIDVGIDDEISLLTPPSGARIEACGTPGSRVVLYGRTQPQVLDWGSVPEDGPRREQLVVVVADRQQDLSPLATSVRGAEVSALDALMDEVRVGTRSLTTEEVTTMRYSVERIDFTLGPRS
jgi:hypothetical protein